MQSLYDHSVSTDSPELMMMSLDMLIRFPLYPSEPPEELVDRLMKDVGCSHDIAYMSLLVYGDENNAREWAKILKTRNQNFKMRKPNFHEIKQLLIKNRALEFALNCWNSKSNILKQSAFQMIPSLISDYPDHAELVEMLGDTDQKRSFNCRQIEEVLLNMGQNHYMRTEYHAALKSFEDASKFGRMSATVAYLMGLAHKDLQNTIEAQEFFRAALELSRGRFADARLEYASLLLKYGKEDSLDEAVNHLAILTSESSHPKIQE
eukprot:UN28997